MLCLSVSPTGMVFAASLSIVLALQLPTVRLFMALLTERLKIREVTRATSAKWLHMMNVQSDIRRRRNEWLSPFTVWIPSWTPTFDTTVIVSIIDLVGNPSPFWTV